MADTPLLEVRNASKAFGAVQALYRVDFEIRPGEVMALVGDNGAGKSTLIKGIAGIYPFDEGEVLVDGKRTVIHGPRDAARLGIEVVYQDLALADNLDVVANMFLGRERTLGAVVLDESSMERTAGETLESLSVTTLKSVRQTVAGLSGGQRQSVAVAKAVMWNSRVVILDEPTAALGVAQTRQVLEPRTAPGRAGSRRRNRHAQPPRRVRGRRQDHRAPPRSARGALRAGEDHAAGGRPRDHRREARARPRHGGRRPDRGRG